MNRKTRVALIAALVLLLVAAVVVGVTLHDRAESDPSESPAASLTPQPIPDKETPTPTDAPETDAPEETPEESAAPTETPEAAETPTPTPETQTVTITIVCTNALRSDALPEGVRAVLPAGGVILQRTVTLEPGDTVWSVTQRACSAAGVSIETTYAAAQSAVYVEGIGQLYEFDCGQGSGWIYKVNGAAPGVGCDSCVLHAGDSITWAYSCNYGNDV